MAGGNYRGPNPSLPRQNIIPDESKQDPKMAADWIKKAAREIYEDIVVRGASAWASQSVVKIEKVIARNVPQPPTDERAEFEKWAKSLPKCISDDGGCEGDLVGLDHEPDCPMFGKQFATHWDAWQARAELEVVPQGSAPDADASRSKASLLEQRIFDHAFQHPDAQILRTLGIPYEADSCGRMACGRPESHHEWTTSKPEVEGTFSCPICGLDTPHEHTMRGMSSLEQDVFRSRCHELEKYTEAILKFAESELTSVRAERDELKLDKEWRGEKVAALESQVLELTGSRAEIAGECYQLAGAVGAPARVLDALSGAAKGDLFVSFLPVSPDECAEISELRETVERLEKELKGK